MSNSLPVFLLLLPVLLLLHPAHAQTPLQRTQFTNRPAPPGWTPHDPSALTTTKEKFVNVNTDSPAFRTALLATSLTYDLNAPAPGTYTLRVGAIEKKGCLPGRRLLRFSVNSVTAPDFSVADEVGCDTPFSVDISFNVASDLRIRFSADRLPSKWIPTVSNLQLFSGTLTNTPGASPEPDTEAPAPPAPTSVSQNVGPVAVLNSRRVNHNTVVNTAAARDIPPHVFKTSRQGAAFSLSFDLPAGTYDIELAFVETTACSPGERVFNIAVNGHARLEAFDIFAKAGCNNALVETLRAETVDALMPQPITIGLRAIAADASLSYVRISPARAPCIPVTDSAHILADHLAHAVPGTYPPGGASSYVDRSGAGSVTVRLDGSGSHTHFAYAGKSGKIMSYRWTIPETGKLISTQMRFKHTFPLGTTRLKLTVMDNACSTDEAETSVSVTGNMQPGAYCYYYKGLPELPAPGTLLTGPRPDFAAVAKSLKFGFPTFPFADSSFVARCILSVEFTKASKNTVVSLTTRNSGNARVYEGEELVLDSETSSKSAPLVTAVGLSAFEVIYRHTPGSRRPALTFKVNGKLPGKVFHDQSTVVPIITSITPSSGRLTGGSRIKISGFGLYQPLKIRFGSQKAVAQRNGATDTQVFTLSPASSQAKSVEVTVRSSIGLVSNVVKYSYGDDCDDVAFEKQQMKDGDGDFVGLTQPTAIASWQDGRLFVGTRIGVVQVVEYDSETLVTKSVCTSEKLTDDRYKKEDGTLSERSIMGITFDPRDKVARPYVSVSTLYWERHRNIDRANKEAWSNGAIERLRPASSATRAGNAGQCLEYDRNIVRNLPVADGDHAVNELVFDQQGDLLIAVGGYTNMGLPYGGLGGNWETYFSGSVVKARLSKGASFNGAIPYTTPRNLRTASPKAGYNDVVLHATGVRNLFSMAMSRSGKIYALDMGPNCGFGNASSACSEYVESEAAQRSTSKFEAFPGQLVVGPAGECRHGDDRPDKLLEIKKGKFYGHANLQRAAITKKSGECRWVDPETNRVPAPLNVAPPANYEEPLALVKSPKTGVREYGAQLFCGKLRGDLILSQMNNRGVWRASPRANGDGLDGNPFMFFTNGGIRVEENARGDLLFPKYYNNPTQGVFVMRPKVSARSGLFVANAVPFRHGRAGGTKLILGGWGFEKGVSVKVGAKECAVVSVSASEIVCTVPAFSGSGNSVDVSVSQGGFSSQLSKAVLYMDV